MLGELFFGIYFNLSVWYKLSDQTKWGAYFSIAGCIVTVAIILGFVPVYGYMACAWASFVCNLLMMLLSYFVGQKKFPISYDLKSAFIYFALAIVLYSAGMFPVIESEVLRLSYRTVLLIVFLIVIVKRDFPQQKRH
jgi:O-antigen/teichoic acid export membrane protein